MDIISKIYFKLFNIKLLEYPTAKDKKFIDAAVTIKNDSLRILLCKMMLKYKLDLDLTKSIIIEESYFILLHMQAKYGDKLLEAFYKSLEEDIKPNKYISYLYKALEYVFLHMYTKDIKSRTKPRIYINAQCIPLSQFEPQVQELLLNSNKVKQQQIQNPFNRWFVENKDNLLTEKQMDYIKNPNNPNLSRNHRYSFRKWIAKRVLKKYNQQFSNTSIKQVQFLKQYNLLQNILGSYDTPKDFINKITYFMDKDFVSSIIYSNNLTTKVLRELTIAYGDKRFIPSKSTLQSLYNLFSSKSDELNIKLNTYKKELKKQVI